MYITHNVQNEHISYTNEYVFKRKLELQKIIIQSNFDILSV